MNFTGSSMAPVLAVVELTAEEDEQRRSRLLEAAYGASRGGVVYLVLRGLTRPTVDRLLDPIVRAVGLNVAGVRYLDSEDTAAVREVITAAQIVVVGGGALRSVLESAGVRTTSVEEALLAWSPGENSRARAGGLMAGAV